MSRIPVLSLALLLGSNAAVAQSLPVVELTAAFHRVEAEVAATQQTRQVGLMHRKNMAPHHGMLFIFDQTARHCMWMKNTFIPLAVAFLDEAGRIINIEEMQPQSEKNHCAAQPARYALEMNSGWFNARGLGAGTTIGGIDRLR